MKIKALVLVFLMLPFIHGCSLAKYMVDHAPYTLIESDEEFEIRRYESIVLVSTSMERSEENSPDDSAFMRLFDFISGANAAEQEISMTAPVFMDENKLEKMSFVMPKSFDLATTPKPENDAVVIDTIDNQVYAVIRFNGSLDPATVSEKKSELNVWMTKRSLERAGNPILAGYDPPSSLPIFRRNEVLLPIVWPPVSKISL